MEHTVSPQFFSTLISIGIALTTAIIMLVVGHSVVKAVARDPMSRRVRALNDRREQLKAGVAASKTRRRAHMEKRASVSITRMKKFLGSMKMLQDSQLKTASLNLSRAGIRTKDAAITVIFFRLVAPIMIGATSRKKITVI
ncbi:MAG: type II secretion system F family protein, partial [Sphingomonadales bacterium]